jgi:hypothetical protein
MNSIKKYYDEFGLKATYEEGLKRFYNLINKESYPLYFSAILEIFPAPRSPNLPKSNYKKHQKSKKTNNI